ncbi:MAG: RNase P subunit p30 family protein [Nanoarchaeota archaeon]|nr:RNase P subunit p30 family protein [Nanoarchaeota archaeon]
MTQQIIICENTFEKARKLIKENQNKIIIFNSEDDELNRKILEKLQINILLINLAGKKDFQKQRDSGFNQVLAKIAKEKNVEIGINFDEIIQASQYEKPKIISRIKQNVALCNKNKLKMKFIIQNKENQRDIYDLKSLGAVLGMPTWMTKTL